MRAKFEELKKKEITKIENSNKESKDVRIIKWIPGKTYRVRLLFSVSPNRSQPFIHKNVHKYYDESNKKLSWVTCPTSEYISDKNGFKECPICSELGKLYKDKEAGSASAAILYKEFKRNFFGFAPVFVVSDPNNEENIGKIKIIEYKLTIYEFLKREVFGINIREKTVVADDDIVGACAFDLKSGKDLIITVSSNKTSQGTFNQYSAKFANNATAIPLTEEQIDQTIKDLNFEKDFYTISSKDELMKFYTGCFKPVEINVSANTEIAKVSPSAPATSSQNTTDENDAVAAGMIGKPVVKENTNKTVIPPKSQETISTNVIETSPAKVESTKVETVEPTDGEIDIDELLKDI